MAGYLTAFEDIFNSSVIPPLTDQVLTVLEDFLLYAVNSEFHKHNQAIITYFIFYISQIAEFELGNDEQSVILQNRLLFLSRYLRPRIINTQNTDKLKELCLKILNKHTGDPFYYAFAFLVDLFGSFPKEEKPEKLENFLLFTLNKIDISKQPIEQINHQFLINVTYSFRNLIQTVKDHHELAKTYLLKFVDAFMNIAYECMTKDHGDLGFPKLQVVIAKSFRFVQRLFELLEMLQEVPHRAHSVILKLYAHIPGNYRSMNIYQNYLICACFALTFDDSDKIATQIHRDILKFLPLCIHPPLSKCRRSSILIQTLIGALKKRKPKNIFLLKTYLPYIWPLFGSIHTMSHISVVAYELLQQLIVSEGVLKTQKSLTTDLISQCIACLELLQIEIENADYSNPKPFDVIVWIDTQLHILKVLNYLISSDLVKSEDETANASSNEWHSYQPRLMILERLINYASFFLNISETLNMQNMAKMTPFSNYVLKTLSLKEYRDRLSEILTYCANVIRSIPTFVMSRFLHATLMQLLPMHNHGFHRYFHIMIMKRIQKEHPTVYYQAFFHLLVQHFDELFKPEPSHQLLELTRQTFFEIITEDSKTSDAFKLIVSDLCEFVMKSLTFQNPLIIELILAFFHSVNSHKQNPRVVMFVQKFVQTPIPFNHLIKLFNADEQLDVQLSLLSLFLYQLCDPNQKNINEWFPHFLPSLSSETHFNSAIPYLYTLAVQHFSEWTTQISPENRQLMLKCLTSSLNRLTDTFQINLLSRIPEYVVEFTHTLPSEKRKKLSIDVEGTEVIIEPFIDSMKKYPVQIETNIDLYFDIFSCLIQSMSFYDAVTSKFVRTVLDNIMKHKPSLFEEAHIKSNAYYYFQMKELKHFDKENIENAEETISDFIELCYSRATAKTAVQIIGELMDQVPISPLYNQVAHSLVAASNYELDIAFEVSKKYLIDAPYSTDEDKKIIEELYKLYSSIAMSLSYNTRQFGIKMLPFFEKYGYNEKIDRMRKEFIKKFRPLIEKPGFQRADFIFYKNLKDIPDGINLIQGILAIFQGIPTKPIDPELFSLIKRKDDEIFTQYNNARILIKTIAHLLPYVPNNKQSLTLWESVVSTLRQDERKHYLPYFIKKCAKTGAYPDPSGTYFGNSNVPPIQHFDSTDVALLTLLAKTGKESVIHNIQKWIHPALTSLLHLYSTGENHLKIEKLISDIFDMIAVMKDVNTKVEMTDICKITVDYSLLFQNKFIPFDPPLEIVASKWPREMLKVFGNELKNKFNLNTFLLLVELCKKPNVDEFRSLMIDSLLNLFDKILEKYQTEKEYVLDNILATIAIVVQRYPQTPLKIFQLAIKILLLYPTLKYKPGIVRDCIYIFCPINYNIDQEFISVFNDTLIPFVFEHTNIFAHPSFVNRFHQFIKRFEIENPVKTFPQEIDRQYLALLLNPDIQYESIPDSPITYSYLMHYAINSMDKKENPDKEAYMINSTLQAMAIEKGYLPLESAFSISRIFAISKHFSNENKEISKAKELLLDKLKFMPFCSKPAISSFRTFAQQKEIYNFDDKQVIMFLIQFVVINIFSANSNAPDRTCTFLMCQVFKQTTPEVAPKIAERMIDIFLSLSPFALSKESVNYWQNLPFAFEPFAAYINPAKLVIKNIEKIREKLEDTDLPAPRFKLILQYIPFVADILYKNAIKPKLPAAFKPTLFFQSSSKDLFTIYQTALHSLFVASHHLAREYVDELHKVLSSRVNGISEKLSNPFAAVAKWMSDVSNDSKNASYIDYLNPILEALRPNTEEELRIDIKSLEYPLHPLVDIYIEKLINEHYPMVSHIFLTKHSDKLLDDAWNTDWFTIPSTVHIKTFAKMLLPSCLHPLIRFIPPKQIGEIICHAINKDESFTRFFDYFKDAFPESPLTHCFNPLPSHDLRKKVQFLEQINLLDESLGLIKQRYPEVKYALTFEQLANYHASKAYFLNEITDTNYFNALIQLRSVDLNLSFASIPNLFDAIVGLERESSISSICLPYLQHFSPQSSFKTMFSSAERLSGKILSSYSYTFLPHLLKSSLVNEIYTTLKRLQQRLTPNQGSLDFTRKWMGGLDQQNFMISCLSWRIAVLSNPQCLSEESVKINRQTLAKLLFKSGALHKAANQFVSCPTKIKLDIDSLPYFLNRFPDNANFKFDISRLLMENQAITEPEQWLRSFISIASRFPKAIDAGECIKWLAKTIKPNNANMIMGFAVGLLKQDPAKTSALFLQLFMPTNFPDKIKSQMIPWSPFIVKYSDATPLEFLFKLMAFDTTRFISMAREMAFNRTYGLKQEKNFTDLINAMQTNQQERRFLFEFDAAFSWIRECEKDILDYTHNIAAHFYFYESLSLKEPQPIPDQLKKITGETIEDVGNYCQSHIPVLKLSKKNTRYESIKGFNFFNRNIIKLDILSDGVNEAKVATLASDGSLESYSLVSPMVTHFQLREYILMQFLQSICRKIAAARTRANFFYYPESVLVHQQLLIIYAPPVTSMQLLFHEPLAYMEACKKENYQDDSPCSYKHRRELNIAPTVLKKHFLDNADGNMVDYLFTQRSFAAHLGAVSCLRMVFKAYLPQIQNLIISDDCLHAFIPEFFIPRQSLTAQLPLTNHVQFFIPEYIMQGSFTASWHIMIEAMEKRKDELRLFLKPLVLDTQIPGRTQQQSSNQLDPMKYIDSVVKRVTQMSTHCTEGEELCDEPFPFVLLDHIIETGNNTLQGQGYGMPWY